MRYIECSVFCYYTCKISVRHVESSLFDVDDTIMKIELHLLFLSSCLNACPVCGVGCDIACNCCTNAAKAAVRKYCFFVFVAPPPPTPCLRQVRRVIKILRAKLGMYPLETNRDVRKLKWQYKVHNMPDKSLPAIVDRAVWEKATKGRAGIRWDNVVEKIWKNIRGDQEEVLST